jgi:hypothetical protein
VSDDLKGDNAPRVNVSWVNSDAEYLCPIKEWNFEVVIGR